jgi:hypothetical protein
MYISFVCVLLLLLLLLSRSYIQFGARLACLHCRPFVSSWKKFVGRPSHMPKY